MEPSFLFRFPFPSISKSEQQRYDQRRTAFEHDCLLKKVELLERRIERLEALLIQACQTRQLQVIPETASVTSTSSAGTELTNEPTTTTMNDFKIIDDYGSSSRVSALKTP